MFARQMLKRVLDVVVGSALLALLAPLFGLIGAFIKVFGGPGPVFTREERISPGGTSFLAWRFRSAPHPHTNDTSTVGHIEEPTRTPVGVWLHRYNLDELPMLINVVLGDIGLLDIVQS